MGGACSIYGGEWRCIQGFGGVTWRKETTWKMQAYRWEDNIKMYLQEVVCEGIDWIDMAENRDSWRGLVNVVMNLWVP